MNSYERVMATIMGEPVDRVPATAVLGMYGARLIGCELEEFYTKADRYVEGQRAIVDKFAPDFLLSPLCVANEAKAFGCEIKYFSNNPPNIVKRAIESVKDIKSLVFPNIDTNPFLLYTRETIRGIAQQYHGQIPLGAVWMDPLDMLANAIGLESFMELAIFHKAEFDEVMGIADEFCVSYGNALLSDGADVLVNFGSLCNVAMITKEMAETIVKPVLDKAYSKLNGGILFHHGGYKIGAFIEIYKDLPNLLGMIIDSKDNLTKAREAAGANLVIAGNLEGPLLDLRTPKQIEAICNRMLQTMEGDKHFMLCTSAADIPYRTEEENIQTFLRAPERYGTLQGGADHGKD